MATPFEYTLGVNQGRIESSNAVDGTHVFELGFAGGETEVNVDVGDYSDVAQVINFDTASEYLVRPVVIVREPPEASADVAWELRGLVNSVVYYRRLLQSNGRSLVLNDIVLFLRGLSSPVTIGFRLHAVTP